jgi:trimethylamine--corrinoid protein Co-methyltransferase
MNEASVPKLIHSARPAFRILSSKQLEKLHASSVQIIERTGVSIGSKEALQLLQEAGADVSNPKRVRIPAHLIERALQTKPCSIVLHTREGEPSIFLDREHIYFGAVPDCPDILDPFTHRRRPCYAEDTASQARLIDDLPNITWIFTAGWAHGIPGEIADKVSLIQALLNSSKPVGSCINDVASLRSMIEVCSIIAGGTDALKKKPFFFGTVEPVTPLVQGKDALEKSLLCAEFGIPNVIYSMPMAGATGPATFAGTLAVCNAEFLSHLVVVQLKSPGAPVIYGSMPNIMDMRTSIYPYGAPELNLLVACLTELSHFYKLPMWGTAGCTDAKVIGAQAGAELMYQCLVSYLSGADFVHDTGLMDHATMTSPELIVFMDEIIGMVRVLVEGIEISDQTLALDLVEAVGPGGTYIAEDHTLDHFRNFWVPRVMDRSRLNPDIPLEPVRHSEQLIQERTKKILETHAAMALPEDVVKEIRRVEEGWFKKAGLRYEYPRRSHSRSKK